MSFCRKEGKDIIIFATASDHKDPSKIALKEPEPQPGLIMPDGSINWNCPCLGGMATGPCGVEFRDAFSCFHYSKADPKGSDCFENFRKMQLCMAKYPTLYNNPDDDEDSIHPDFADKKGNTILESDGTSNAPSTIDNAVNSNIKKDGREK